MNFPKLSAVIDRGFSYVHLGDATVECPVPTVVARELTPEYAALFAAAPDLLESLQHMQVCSICAQGSWEDCDGGKKALVAIAVATGGRS